MIITTYGLQAALAMALLLIAEGLWCCWKKLGYGVWIRQSVLTIPLAFLMSRVLFSLFAIGNGDFSSPVQALYFWDGGASITGAFIGAVIAAALTEKACGVSGGVLLDGVGIGAPLAIMLERLCEPGVELGIGRIVDTEFLAFLGAATDDRHPVYLYCAVAAVLILLALLHDVARKDGKRRNGDVLLTFMTFYGCVQVILESLRDDAHMVIYFIRINQIAGLVMAVIAFVIWTVRWVRSGAKGLHVTISCVVLIAAIAQGVVQEFAVDSNPNLLLEYAIMAACLAVVAAVTLFVRSRAERA
ncbi:MAG: prolipoprotein diacylglyceryl transferase [Clostridia bacterium]|nr:prolipoprotein diacylglyceryl transferase [Clostridia bacterium]